LDAPGKYISDWGGHFGGSCQTNGTLIWQGTAACYGTNTEHSMFYGFSLYIAETSVNASRNIDKEWGNMVRCVMDAQ
jgi:hypothetical protein